jgi:hypothetical protein
VATAGLAQVESSPSRACGPGFEAKLFFAAAEDEAAACVYFPG